jgi:hypothetical protein
MEGPVRWSEDSVSNRLIQQSGGASSLSPERWCINLLWGHWGGEDRIGVDRPFSGIAVPDQAQQALRSPFPKVRYRGKNGREEDQALPNRGRLTGWVTPEALAAGQAPPPGLQPLAVHPARHQSLASEGTRNQMGDRSKGTVAASDPASDGLRDGRGRRLGDEPHDSLGDAGLATHWLKKPSRPQFVPEGIYAPKPSPGGRVRRVGQSRRDLDSGVADRVFQP